MSIQFSSLLLVKLLVLHYANGHLIGTESVTLPKSFPVLAYSCFLDEKMKEAFGKVIHSYLLRFRNSVILWTICCYNWTSSGFCHNTMSSAFS